MPDELPQFLMARRGFPSARPGIPKGTSPGAWHERAPSALFTQGP